MSREGPHLRVELCELREGVGAPHEHAAPGEAVPPRRGELDGLSEFLPEFEARLAKRETGFDEQPVRESTRSAFIAPGFAASHQNAVILLALANAHADGRAMVGHRDVRGMRGFGGDEAKTRHAWNQRLARLKKAQDESGGVFRIRGHSLALADDVHVCFASQSVAEELRAWGCATPHADRERSAERNVQQRSLSAGATSDEIPELPRERITSGEALLWYSDKNHVCRWMSRSMIDRLGEEVSAALDERGLTFAELFARHIPPDDRERFRSHQRSLFGRLDKNNGRVYYEAVSLRVPGTDSWRVFLLVADRKFVDGKLAGTLVYFIPIEKEAFRNLTREFNKPWVAQRGESERDRRTPKKRGRQRG